RLWQAAGAAAWPVRLLRRLFGVPRVPVPPAAALGRDAHPGGHLVTLMARPHATTIIGVKRGGQVAIAGDGQVTVGEVVMKHRAAKVRRMYRDEVITGFAGAVADAFTLFDKFEQHLERHQGHLLRASVGLSKEWRTDKYLRRLDAMLVVANRQQLLLLSGDGDIIEPDDDIAAIGSGGPYAHAAARALVQSTDLS